VSKKPHQPNENSPLEGVLSILESRPRAVAIVTDYDGTIAPIVDDPALAYPDLAALTQLDTLSELVGAAAVISGRTSKFLEKMIPSDRIVRIGLYGLERARDEAIHWKAAIEEATRAAQEFASLRPEPYSVEPKGLSVVLHFRRAPDPDLAAQTVREWADTQAQRLGLRVLVGRMVVELVPPLEVGKGRALRDFLEEVPAALEAVVYLGDDIGDVEAFEAAKRWASMREGRAGLAVAVGSDELDPAIEDAADLVLPSQHDVAGFLESLTRAARRPDKIQI